MRDSLFDTVKAATLSRLVAVLSDLLPGGRVRGNEYVCANVNGGTGESCKTNLSTGVGKDFAIGEKWGDPIALVALIRRCGQKEAALHLAERYGIDTGNGLHRPTGARAKAAPTFTPIMPITDPAPDFPREYRNAQRWCYRDAGGKPLFYTFRVDRPDGGKEFAPFCLVVNGSGPRYWRKVAPPAPRQLYGLDRLARSAPGTPVLLVEGEKTADAAQAMFPDFVGMTWMGGSNAVGKTDFSPLAARSIIVWPDNDAPGIRAAVELVGILKTHAAEVRIVFPPEGLPEKWDMADPLPEGFDPRQSMNDALDADEFLQTVRAKYGDPSPVLEFPDEPFDVPAWPELSRDALPGFIGEFVELATRDSEADPVAVLATLLVRFGAEVHGYQQDGGPYLTIGETRHPPRLFAVICGNSSKSRKGTSRQPVVRLFKRDLCDPNELAALNLPLPARESGGPLSTGEGLAYQLREDAQDTGRNPGDKRLCIMDEELASGLSCTKREGNTLSMAIRTFWDGGDYSPLTKTNPMHVKGAHICLLSHITKAELDTSLSNVNMANGFGNRFLWICVRRSKLVSLPRPMPREEIADMQFRLWKLVAQAQKMGEVVLTRNAEQTWLSIYRELSVEVPGLTGAVVNRAEAQTLRLALLYALLDGKRSIDAPHIESALALWRYANASAIRLFGDRATDPIEQKIIALLRDGPLTTTELHRAFSNNVSGAKLQQILIGMEAANCIAIRQDSTTGGRPSTAVTLL